MTYAVIKSFGGFPPIRTIGVSQQEESDPWRIALIDRLEFLCQNTFAGSGQSEFIFDIEDIVRDTINSVTIENSLLFLQYYLGFKFPNPGKVIDYLQKHRNLYDIVLYACILTEEHFGQRAQISLELYQDPEIHDEYLTIFVRQEEYEPDIIDKIDAICREYEPGLAGIDGYLLVNTDFQPPVV
jgi:hypothetical protein